MVYDVTNSFQLHLVGKSTDTKPTDADYPYMKTGSWFYELDTRKKYQWYKESGQTGTWYLQKGGSGSFEAVIAWNGQSTPVVADIPAGVQVTYNGTTYTGTLVASENTTGKLYLVYNTNGTSPDVYDEYLTIGSGTYSWEKIGKTTIDLSTCVQYVAQSKTESEKAIARNNIGAQAVVEIEVLGSSDT